MASTNCSFATTAPVNTSKLYTITGVMNETYVSGGAENYSTINCTAYIGSPHISFSAGVLTVISSSEK